MIYFKLFWSRRVVSSGLVVRGGSFSSLRILERELRLLQLYHQCVECLIMSVWEWIGCPGVRFVKVRPTVSCLLYFLSSPWCEVCEGTSHSI